MVSDTPRYEKVEFKTIDRLTLRGCLYKASGRAPVIIMTPGFNCVKEMLLPDVAEWFQKSGFHALIYDPRSIGDSEGQPRNLINPLQQAEDLSDVVTHMATFPGVDASGIVLWGMSFGATVSGCAAAVDRRVKGLVMVCPIVRFFAADKRDKGLGLVIRDRQSQLRGNEALTVAPFNRKGENPIGMAGSGGPGGLEAYQFMAAVIDRGVPNFRNTIAVQSYHKLAVWRPRELMHDMMADSTRVMMITPELDQMSPLADQAALFDGLREPKEFLLVKEKGHLDLLSGEGSEEVLQAQAAFIRQAVGGTPRE
ncbi:polyketide transferase ATR5-like protein [Staphylotrichum tortipilum]|uniref:Polyketide transferase ATR5-like protein n=1 Tax=Staphylotrichum tortipilum TaxID=2831512 RepID=A0AAN6RU52_9PEZI|nr:polyketide transferase ATR5-like protein [Staphylotrichum longicolle]